jgi:NAD(P)H-dependent FMN reductase
MQIKILALCGSSRRDSLNQKLLAGHSPRPTESAIGEMQWL